MRLLFALESGLPSGQYLMINNPTNQGKYTQAQVYAYDKSRAQVSMLGSLGTPLQRLDVQATLLGQFIPMQLNGDLAPNTWYILEVFPATFSSLSATSVFSLYTTSQSTENGIVYD